MTWGKTDKQQHLSSLHGEGRYYRIFHHTLLSIIMAGNIALAIVLVNALNDSVGSAKAVDYASLMTIIALASLFLLVIPAILTYLIIAAHFSQGKIREQIRKLQVELEYPDEYLEDEKYEGFQEKKCLEKFLIGRGHKSFIALLWIMVIINIGLCVTIIRMIT